jgi:hypothetical protein
VQELPLRRSLTVSRKLSASGEKEQAQCRLGSGFPCPQSRWIAWLHYILLDEKSGDRRPKCRPAICLTRFVACAGLPAYDLL